MSTPLAFAGIVNARDLGGTPLKGGKHVKNGLLLRSGSLVRATDDDLETLRTKYDLRRVFDFRCDYEVELSPDKRIEGTEYHHCGMIDSCGKTWQAIYSDDSSDADPLDILCEYAKKDEVRKASRDMYISLTCSPETQKQYSSFMRGIVEAREGGLLFHCSYGKDRTGVGAMLILSALGAGRDEIVRDYALSNIVFAPRLEIMKERIGGSPDEQTMNVLRTFLTANVEYFERGLDNLEKEYGCAEAYLSKAIGLTDKDIQILRDRYTE